MSTPKTRRMDELELATVESIVEPDDRLTLEIMATLDPDHDQNDPLVTPWRRSHSDAFRAALSH